MKAVRSLLMAAALCFFISAIFIAGCAKTGRTELDSSPSLPSPTSRASALIESGTAELSQLETIYGVAPVDWVDSKLSREYFPRLVKAYKATISEPDNESYGMDGYPFQLFAAEPFEEGALLFAGYTIDQDFPELYYLEGDKLYCAVGSEYFSLNYTVFRDHTISYGFTLDDAGSVNRSVKTVGSFANGETDESLSCSGNGYWHRYILVADGQTWLSSIDFFDSEGGFVTDENSNQIGWNQDSYHWVGKPNEVWNVQRYTQMRDDTEYQHGLVLKYGGSWEYETEMHAFADDGGAGIQYVWRSHNNLVNQGFAVPAQEIFIKNLPSDAQIYWVDIERDDGKDESIGELMERGGLLTPDEAGVYCLLVKANGFIHTLFINVEESP